MGFITRTIFWSGMVYSAMPLDFGSLVSDRFAAVTDGNPLTPCVRGVAEDCRRRVGELRKALDAAAALGLVDHVVQATGEAAPKDPATEGRAVPPRRPPL